jgi:hypothetical protein
MPALLPPKVRRPQGRSKKGKKGKKGLLTFLASLAFLVSTLISSQSLSQGRSRISGDTSPRAASQVISGFEERFGFAHFDA